MPDSEAVALNRHLARRIRELRTERDLSLEALATKSGVSRSMISLIERGESSPTAVVLNRLATGLGVVLASLFETTATPTADAAPANPHSRPRDQPLWRDPESGYERRQVSSPTFPHPIQVVEVKFPAGARVAFENGGRENRIYQQVWMLEGTMHLTIGNTRHEIRAGDCLAMDLDRPTIFHNPTKRAARYAVVLTSDRALSR